MREGENRQAVGGRFLPANRLLPTANLKKALPDGQASAPEPSAVPASRDTDFMPSSEIKICLTIAGLDPSGGAGVLADVKTFETFGCFGAAAVTSVTFQNTTGVFGAVHQTAESVRRQVEPIIEDYNIDAVKTGMLPTQEVIEETARLLINGKLKNIVVDPVVRSTSGYDLIDNDALRSLVRNLFPLADLITPNLPEAERISGVAIESDRDIQDAAQVMREMGARNVLIKGGHFENAKLTAQNAESNSSRIMTDFFFVEGEMHRIEGDFYETTATHGTGCVLSAAVAANLAGGNSLLDSVEAAKKFVNQAIRTAPNIGRGHSPINIKRV